MPAGLYLHLDPTAPPGTPPTALERFSCAPGPAGWRYVSALTEPDGPPLGRVDVTVDGRWRQLRAEVAAGSWLVRGGVTGQEVVWVRVAAAAGTTDPVAEQTAPAAAFTGRSPGLVVPVVRLLGLAEGARARLAVVLLTEPGLATRRMEQGWTRLESTRHPSDLGELLVERYEVADLSTGERAQWHLAGDVVLAGPALELAELAGPPSVLAGAP
ncbi:MAG: hypothetical protein NVSMB13_17140 [Mycobacteriales bacterium]